jgi:hypothetical protein
MGMLILWGFPILFLTSGAFLMAYSVIKLVNWHTSPTFIVGLVWVSYGLAFTLVNITFNR